MLNFSWFNWCPFRSSNSVANKLDFDSKSKPYYVFFLPVYWNSDNILTCMEITVGFMHN